MVATRQSRWIIPATHNVEQAISMTWADKLRPLNDITTDTDNPPLFIAAWTLRSRWHNSLDYPGIASARLQQRLYPDIKTITSPLPPEQACLRASMIMSQLHWSPHYHDPAAGHMEAVTTTRLLRFSDDIVVRVTVDDRGSRIDLRSCSRLGKSDLGANAHRIRAFIVAFKAELSVPS